MLTPMTYCIGTKLHLPAVTPTIARLLVLLLAGSVSCLMALDLPENRASLRGITTIAVVVEDLSPDPVSDGLTTDQIRTDVELRLRKSGVKIEARNTSYLYVKAHPFKSRSTPGLYAYSVDVEFIQPAKVSNGVSVPASTWSIGDIGIVGQANMSKGIRDDIGDFVDRFLNAYLSVNPNLPL
jgi:hypothetical protein